MNAVVNGAIDPAARLDVDTLPALRDQLIAEKNGAIKYDPILQDIVNGGGLLARYKNDDLQTIHDAVKAFADTAHRSAIAALRLELQNDPDGVKYSGKTPDEIQTLLMTQIPVFSDIPVGPTEVDKLDYLAAKIRAEPYDFPVRTERVQIMIKPPPIGRIWQGIPYCRNLPSIDNINEALQP